MDDIKAQYIANTVERLLKSCTTKVPIPKMPLVSYKAVRVNVSNHTYVEAHIFPDSLNTFVVKLYTKENGTVYLHGKYNDYAYQLIAMLEVGAK